MPVEKDTIMIDWNRYPPGWDRNRVQRLIYDYESQTEEEAVAEDETAFVDKTHTVMVIPNELVQAVGALLAKHTAE